MAAAADPCVLVYDVGGSHKMSQTGYESFGIRSQNRVIIEGIDATESTGGDGNFSVDRNFYIVVRKQG